MNNWEEVKLEDVPKGVVFVVQPRDMGQIVEYAYGSFSWRYGADPSSDPYMKVTDGSIGPVPRYYRRKGGNSAP